MRRAAAIFCLCLAWTIAARAGDAAAAPKKHPDSSKWQDLFAKDLSNAIFPKGIWSCKNGELTATKDEIIWTKKPYGDCILDLEFKTTPKANSGVFVYGTDLVNWVANSVEVQILDDFSKEAATYPKTWRCAAIFGRLAPSKSAVKKPGLWNRMTITCRGPKIDVLLNGHAVTTMDMRKWTDLKKNPDGSEIPSWLAAKPLAKYPTRGHIGLQGKHGNAAVSFRNLKVKELPADQPRALRRP